MDYPLLYADAILATVKSAPRDDYEKDPITEEAAKVVIDLGLYNKQIVQLSQVCELPINTSSLRFNGYLSFSALVYLRITEYYIAYSVGRTLPERLDIVVHSQSSPQPIFCRLLGMPRQIFSTCVWNAQLPPMVFASDGSPA